MQGRIKKVTMSYYTLDGEFSHEDVRFYPQYKYKYLPFWLNMDYNYGYWSVAEAKKALFKKIGESVEKSEIVFKC